MAIKPEQVKTIELLLAGEHKRHEVANAVGVSPRTLQRWIHEDLDFIRAWESAVARHLDSIMLEFKAKAVEPAIKALLGVLNDPEASRADKIKAASQVLLFTGQRPADKHHITHEGNTEISEKMSEEEARAILAQATRAGLYIQEQTKEGEED